LNGVSLAFDTFFHEAVLTFDRPIAPLLKILAEQDILGGYDLSVDYPELGHSLLVCATEVRTAEEIDHYVAAMKAVMKKSEAA
jgi:glycine dehydrogenase subunit 1